MLDDDNAADDRAAADGDDDDDAGNDNVAAGDVADDVVAAIATLQRVAADRALLSHVDADTRIALQKVCGEIAKPDLKARKRLQKALLRAEHAARRESDMSLRKRSGIQKLRAEPVFITPPLLTSGPDVDDAIAARDDDTDDRADHDGDIGVDNGVASDVGADDGAARVLHDARVCYICKKRFSVLHSFYDQLCVPCGDENFAKRSPRYDLRGRVALITGARVKIGYHAAIMMLRNGCDVVVTTRFPHDAAARFAKEADAADWLHRLSIWGLDLRHTPSVDALARHLASTLPRLDFVIHNACQTVRRPPGFYAHLMEGEASSSTLALPAAAEATLSSWRAFAAAEQSMLGVSASAALSQLDDHASPAQLASSSSSAAASLSTLSALFPQGALDADLQQIDLRDHNSWRNTLGDTSPMELLEVMLVNAAAPFVLTSKLLPLLKRDNAGRDRHVVNVSAMEGQFYRRLKTDKHPHTNMAKAALNMLTRTSAMELYPQGIYMNAVDTGWITDEDPAHIATRKAKDHAFSPPLDIVDGAARIVDPIFDGLQTGKHQWGIFFKDYKPAPW